MDRKNLGRKYFDIILKIIYRKNVNSNNEENFKIITSTTLAVAEPFKN